MNTALPPGPRGRLLPTLRFAMRPTVSLTRWRRRYGPTFTIRAVNGDVVSTCDPALIKTIFAEHPDTYAPFGVRAVDALVGPESIFVQASGSHRRQRKLLMPPFHGTRMRTYAETFRTVTRRHVASASDVSMLDLAQSISLEIITRAVFGADEGSVETMNETIRRLVDAVDPLVLFLPVLQKSWGGLSPFPRMMRARAATDTLLIDRIHAARRGEGGGDDILSMLVATRDDQGHALSDTEIVDHLRTLLFAGHETTAISLAWAVDQLARHRDVLSRLREDLQSDTPRGWLTAVVNEVLRLFPPVSEVLRTLRRPMTLGKWLLPTGAVVSPSLYLLHRSPELYAEPDAFRPHRFIDTKPNPDHFMPFGGGHRRCIGAAFAQQELTAALETIVREFDFEVQRAQPPRMIRRNITLAPSDGVPIRIKARR